MHGRRNAVIFKGFGLVWVGNSLTSDVRVTLKGSVRVVMEHLLLLFVSTVKPSPQDGVLSVTSLRDIKEINKFVISCFYCQSSCNTMCKTVLIYT